MFDDFMDPLIYKVALPGDLEGLLKELDEPG